MESVTEEFRNVDGFDGYWISNQGTVTRKWSQDERKAQWKRPANAKYYWCVALFQNGKRKNIDVHRLVALAFVYNPNPKLFTDVHHKNDDTLDPRAINLEWCTQSYNEHQKRKQ